jgi:hypothetical protein
MKRRLKLNNGAFNSQQAVFDDGAGNLHLGRLVAQALQLHDFAQV